MTDNSYHGGASAAKLATHEATVRTGFPIRVSSFSVVLKGHYHCPPCSDCRRRCPSGRCLDLSRAQKWIAQIPKV